MGKIYIGKTLKTVEQRWKEHVHDYKRDVMKKRPLYSAINKYGSENFTAEEIEECSAEKLSEREQYWIKFYHSYEDGYNATMGGDGKQYIDYDRIYHLYGQGKLIKEINDITHHDKGTISKILSIKGVSSEDRKNNAHSRIRKKVAKIDLQTGKILEIFPSLTAAENLFHKAMSILDKFVIIKEKVVEGLVGNS